MFHWGIHNNWFLGQEFRALFISTSEPTKSNGETRDSTKSISDPCVFITALTRAQSLVVAVGNPFMLLHREKHMVDKYGDRGHCWSLFLKACLDNKSIKIDPSLKMQHKKCMEMLTDAVNRSIQGLSLPELQTSQPSGIHSLVSCMHVLIDLNWLYYSFYSNHSP